VRANDRYLVEVIEEYSFCPFAREGRRAGKTHRRVYFAQDTDLEPLLEMMEEVAAMPEALVSQVIFPLIEATPGDWRSFCHDLTRLGHRRMGRPPVLAVAALHPRLTYTTKTPFSLLTLFRRSPDPTIQWVRLDGLEAIYEGRGKGTVVMSPSEVSQLLLEPVERRVSLYDRIAQTNMAMAQRLGIERVEAMLAQIARDAHGDYQRILLEADA
jgi:hypothetical protein